MKIQNFTLNQIINTSNGPIKIISYEGLINYIDNNGNINEAQLYRVLYNNEIYYASDMGLCSLDTSIFNKYIANIGYRGYIDFKIYKKEYEIWKNMLYRCYWNNSNMYEYFGAQGVTVCDRWKCFEFFLYDLINITNYDKFISSNITYELDLATKQKKIPINQRMYIPGKISLKPFYQTDVSIALQISKSKGLSSSCVNLNIIDDTKNKIEYNYNRLPDGSYSLQAYQHYINNPKQLSVPSVEVYPYGYVRTFYGFYKL